MNGKKHMTSSQPEHKKEKWLRSTNLGRRKTT